MIRALWSLLSSYWLACTLLLCLFTLTFAGTLYQTDHGLYDAKRVFFNSWFLKTESGVPYFPGGVLVMALLTLNLLIGGVWRMKWRLRNAGVLIIHFGILFMLGAGLVKLTNSEEGNLSLREGEQSSYFISSSGWQVSIWEITGPQDVPQWVIEDALINDLGDGASRNFHTKELPFNFTLSNFLLNCNALPKGPNWEATGEVIDGFGFLQLEKSMEQADNRAGLHIAVTDNNGTTQKAMLWAPQRAPWTIEVDGRLFAFDFDHTQHPMPFSIRLDKFIKEEHPGMSMAKAFKSEVTRFNANGAQPVLIQMNEPLREAGLVLFQSSFGEDSEGNTFSVFSVVRNPSDKWPEYSLWVITFGLVLTFGKHLWTYVRRQNKMRSKASRRTTA